MTLWGTALDISDLRGSSSPEPHEVGEASRGVCRGNLSGEEGSRRLPILSM